MCLPTFWELLLVGAAFFAASVGCVAVARARPAAEWHARARTAAVVLMAAGFFFVGCFQHLYDVCFHKTSVTNLWMVVSALSLVSGLRPGMWTRSMKAERRTGKRASAPVHMVAEEDVHPGVQWLFVGKSRVSREDFARLMRTENQ